MTWTESLQAPLQYPGVLGDDTTNLKGSLDSQSVNPIMASAPDLSSLIVVDAAVPELEQLIAGLNNSNILLLDRNKDGVAQITTALAASQGTINALHIISHGSDGSISLGNTALNAASLGQYSDTLTQWNRHFSPSGDILVYGCEVGRSEQGQDFLTQLSQLTGADVAASNDLTGAEGDWDLEVSTGAIENAIALDANAQANYQGTLATYNGKEYILTNGSKTWLEAEAEAVSQGGHLVTINDLAEETWLRDTFGSTEGFWIGINDINQEGQFEWVNGEAVTYTNWAPGEPNNAGGNQDYGLMNFRSIRQWDDSSPGSTLRGIIEIETDNPPPPSDNGNGLRGEYFDNINFTNQTFIRTDATVNFDWGGGSPDPRIGADTFSVRWTGQIQPRYSEEYTFFTTSDDGVRLKVNGQTIIDRFVDQPPTTVEGQIRLDAGQKYDIELEYYENGGGAVAELAWQSNSQNRQIIPQSQLFSSTGSGGNAGSFRVEQTSFSVDENDGNASVVVERIGGSSGTAQISYGTTNGSAQAGSDFTNQTGTLTFTNGQTRKTVLIPVTNDNLSEPNETFRFNLSNPTGGASLDSSDTSTITIVDDDDGSFINEVFASGFVLPTAFDWSPDQSLMFVAQKAGQVKVINNGSLQSQNFIDLSDEVNGTRDRGLLGLAVHPDFNSGSPYVYLGYTYDPPEADRTGSTSNTLDDADGRGNRPSRVVRITAEQRNGNWVAQPGSQVVILGRNSTWANTNGTGGNSTTDLTIPPSGIRANGTNINDYLATDSESHTIGQLRFGTDGSLFVSNGDGTSYNTVDPRTTRVQDINNLSGKLLRIDPITGRGLSDNPFYNGNANSNRSKVYAYGFRNPFRFTINPQTGQPFVGDVGWFTWEEVNAVERGQNYGWPLYEGGLNGQSERTERYQDAPEFTPLYAGVTNLQAPLLALPHTNRGGNARAIVMGDFYTGNTFPSIYQNSLFINDADNGNLQALLFDSSGNLTGVKDFNETIPGAVQISTGQDGNLYFASLATGAIRRFRPGASAAARSREASAQPNFIDRPAESPPAQ